MSYVQFYDEDMYNENIKIMKSMSVIMKSDEIRFNNKMWAKINTPLISKPNGWIALISSLQIYFLRFRSILNEIFLLASSTSN